MSVLVLGTSAAFAANPFDEFRNQVGPGVLKDVAQKNLDNFAKDVGALLGSGAAHQGKALGLPGFDVGIHVPGKKISDDDTIVKAAGLDTVYLPVIQAEIGLPKKVDLIGRFSSYQDSNLIGFGLRYGILKGGFPGLPSLSVQAIYNSLNVNANDNKLKATTLSAAATLSIDLPAITPYLSAGIDSTTVDPDSTISTLQGKATGYRVEAGVNLSLFPLTYLQLGGGLINGDMSYTAGLGIKY